MWLEAKRKDFNHAQNIFRYLQTYWVSNFTELVILTGHFFLSNYPISKADKCPGGCRCWAWIKIFRLKNSHTHKQQCSNFLAPTKEPDMLNSNITPQTLEYILAIYNGSHCDAYLIPKEALRTSSLFRCKFRLFNEDRHHEQVIASLRIIEVKMQHIFKQQSE